MARAAVDEVLEHRIDISLRGLCVAFRAGVSGRGERLSVRAMMPEPAETRMYGWNFTALCVYGTGMLPSMRASR